MSQQVYSVKGHNNRYNSSLLIIGNNIPYALHLFQLPSENLLLKYPHLFRSPGNILNKIKTRVRRFKS